ncbi:hypothetical protein B0A48_01743 [Cryoendolithus antarcticus]|uniref:Zn(2)-C6 fungal-type domain-containing protein n=1 Tax=Cryoendolithus antarcticus TaxID=1507870 RepID=A0A1V8TQC8_9PEZI|nr:hypothetical protein B0A48_01743 [Cryoendolithus antarcticus]
MDHLYSQQDGLLDFDAVAYLDEPPDHRSLTYPPYAYPPSQHPQAQWQGIMYDEDMSQRQHAQQYAQQPQRPQRQQRQPSRQYQQQGPQSQQHAQSSRPGSSGAHGLPTPAQVATSTMSMPMPMPMSMDMGYANMMSNPWQYQFQQAAASQARHAQQYHFQDHSTMPMGTYSTMGYNGQLQSSPIDFMPVSAASTFAATTGMDTSSFLSMAGPMESMNALAYPLTDYQQNLGSQFSLSSHNALNQQAAESVHSSVPGSSPAGTILEVQSLSDNEWSSITYNPNRQSLDSIGTVSNPSQNLHIRTHSDSSSSDGPNSAYLSGSFEEIPPWPLSSPHEEFHTQELIDSQYLQHGLPHPSSCHHHNSPASSLVVSPTATGGLVTYRSHESSSSTSPTSSGPTSPPLRRRKSPSESTAKVTKVVTKKIGPVRKDVSAEKKIGRRRGPLRPDQRQQAHEIRKLRACLRCKFLKKTCDKGEPCGGCRPSHARLWQVPCTRLDIKDIGYFMKDWNADYERHVSLGFSVNNIKGFSTLERTLYITHGYGHYLPINAREVFVREDKCFDLDWVETNTLLEYEVKTAKLSAGMEGVSSTLLSEYLDRHLDNSFEAFVDEFFDGTVFLTEILKTAHRYYVKEKSPAIRKALKLVIAYNLTQHVTLVEGLSEEEQFEGLIDDPESKWSGKTVAPVMINFQVKCALADMWRELQKDILEELSSLYSSVYSGEKLKNWPTIFMLAAILLAIWEEMQFDCHYRVPDEQAVNKFCDDMETTPVGVIVGLFQAISTKLPGLQEWDTRKHHHLLGSNPAICDALTEVKGHVNKYESYLKDRANAKFDRDDFDSLNGKFLSKLVIRAN